MKKQTENTKKRFYTSPQIELIKLDNDISLQLESNPPFGPGEDPYATAPEYFNNDPLKTNLG